MTTPYSSFTPVDKYLSKEYPMAVSAYTNVFRERLEFFDTGAAISNVSKFLSSDEFKNLAQATKSVVTTVKTLQARPAVSSSGSKSASGGSSIGAPKISEAKVSFWDKYKTAVIAGSAVVVVLIVTIIVIKLRRK